MENICVFCGSSMGSDSIYKEVAVRLAETFYKHKIRLVFGGSDIGLMKVMADRLMELGGEVIGVMPRFLAEKEIFHKGITKLHVVETMSERKNLLEQLSDGFIALPGGLGTMDELMEMMTLNQLRVHDKPVGILNTKGFYNDLIRFFDHSVKEGFVRAEHRDNFKIAENLDDLLEMMNGFEPVDTKKWIVDIKKESSSN